MCDLIIPFWPYLCDPCFPFTFPWCFLNDSFRGAKQRKRIALQSAKLSFWEKINLQGAMYVKLGASTAESRKGNRTSLRFLSSSTAIAQATKPLESSGRGQPKIRTPDPHIFWVGDPMEFEFYIAFVTTCWDLPLEFGEVRRKNGVVQRSMGYTSNKWGRKEGRKEARKEGSSKSLLLSFYP